MSSNLETVLIKDPLLMLESQLKFGVIEGGSDVSSQSFPSSSASPSSIIINAQMPSTSTVVSRHMIEGADIIYKVKGTVPAKVGDVNGVLFEYGKNLCLAPFPFSQNTTNESIQINNTLVNANVNQILDPVLRGVTKDEMCRWNTSTAVQLDYFGDYDQNNTLDISASPFNGYNSFYDHDVPPRGSFPCEITVLTGSFGNATASPAVCEVEIRFKVREPCFVSPFLFSQPAEKCGLTGISQIIINKQMDSLGKRGLRFFELLGGTPDLEVTGVRYENVYAEFKLLNPKVSDLIPATTVCDLMQYTNFSLPNSAPLLANASTPLTSNAIMLNSYPDMVIVYVRDTQANLTNSDADVYCRIDNVSITLDNRSGLLSTFTTEQIFRASVEHGGSQQNFLDYRGSANAVGGTTPQGTNIVTVGSVLNLAFGTVLAIPQDYYSCGSLTTTQFQIKVNVTNTTGKTITPELNVIFVNSGVLVNSNGASSTYCNGVLDKQSVLDALQKEPVNKYEIVRYMGGGLFSSLKSFASKALPFMKKALPMVKDVLGKVEHPKAQQAHQVLGSLGFGETGGALTGGRRMRHRVK